MELSRKVAQYDKVRAVTVSSKYSSSDLNNNLAGLTTQLAGDISSPKHYSTFSLSQPSKDLEQRDVSQETITTNNGTISNFKQSERNVPDVEPCRELSQTTGAGQHDGQSLSQSQPDQPEKRLIAQQSQNLNQSANWTDEEKLSGETLVGPGQSDCQSDQSEKSTFLLSKDPDSSCKQTSIENHSVSDDHDDHENAMDSKASMTRHESERKTQHSSSPAAPVKADYNIECQEFPLPHSIPSQAGGLDNNENVQTNSECEEADVVNQAAGDRDNPTASQDNQQEFPKTAENHSDTKISASAEEIKTRSAPEDVESQSNKTKEDQDGVMEKLAPGAVEANAGQVDDKDGVNEDRSGSEDQAGEMVEFPVVGRDKENVTSLEVEWLQQTLSITAPFSAGVLTDQSVMTQGGKFYHPSLAADNQTSLPIDFGESLPPAVNRACQQTVPDVETCQGARDGAGSADH